MLNIVNVFSSVFMNRDETQYPDFGRTSLVIKGVVTWQCIKYIAGNNGQSRAVKNISVLPAPVPYHSVQFGSSCVGACKFDSLQSATFFSLSSGVGSFHSPRILFAVTVVEVVVDLCLNWVEKSLVITIIF